MNKVRMAVQYDNGDVIEQDNCTITMNIMPTAEEYKNLGMLYSMLNYAPKIGSSGSSGSSSSDAIQTQMSAFLKKTNNIINTPTLLLYDSLQNKYFKDDYIQKHIDCVGYAESITAFSGSDSKKGTINLQETQVSTKTTNRIVNKLVFDFPTHVANGKIDTVILSPFQFSSTSTTSDGNFPYVKYNLGLLNLKPKLLAPCSNGYNIVTSTMASFALNAENSLMYVAGNTYVYVMKMDFPTTERFENPYFSNDGLVLNVGGEVFYKKTKSISSNEAVKLTVINDELLTTASELNLNIIDKSGDSSWSSNIICAGYFEHTNVKVLVFIDVWNSSTYGNVSVQIFDINNNFIKKYTLKKFSAQSHSANMSVYNNYLFIHIQGRNLYFSISLLTLEIIETSLMVHPYAVSDKSGEIYAGLVNLSDFGTNNYINTTSQLGIMEIDNQGIRIDLAEPIYKNNSQSMKLIFDLDITIE